MTEKVYGDYDQAALDTAYNARATVDFEATMARWGAEAAATRRALDIDPDKSFGTSAMEVLDVFPAGSRGGPMHLFIHGGYWRALTKDEHSFVAAGLVPAGATVAVNSYDLCPDVSLDTIIEQCRRAVVWCWNHAGDYGADAERFTVSGHSAGGHLTAMMLATDWTAYGLPADAIKGIVPVSGLYDLEPLRLAYINEWLRLEAADVPRVSPVHNPVPAAAPVAISYGTKDPAGFHSQAGAYRRFLAGLGIEADLYIQGGADHFDAAFCLRDPASPLSRIVQARMGL